MKTFAFLLLIGCFFLPIKGQNFIGMKKVDVVKAMKKLNPGSDLDESAKNSTYKYLKFVDKYNEETWLIFLSDDDVCTFTKLMSDFSNEKNRRAELDKNYKRVSDNNWAFTDNGVNFTVELKKEEWYFTIVTKKKK
jgi:hypothetical protein